MDPRIQLARLVMVAAVACGVIGLIAAFTDRSLKLGVTGWFTGGALAALIALGVLADQYFASRKRAAS